MRCDAMRCDARFYARCEMRDAVVYVIIHYRSNEHARAEKEI